MYLKQFKYDFTNNSGTPGNTTISKPSGRAAIAASASACIVTNTLVTATSIIIIQVESADATLGVLIPAPAAGSFTVTNFSAGVATNVTANTNFSFIVIN